MSRARKAVDVSWLRDKINFGLAYRDRKLPADLTPEQAYRRGMASVLELVLHETGNYKGFGYLDIDFTVDPPHIPDESRRVYYGG